VSYYVTASPGQLSGLTYLLPSVPAGYTMYGAWGTISQNACPYSATWYVEYDPTPRGDGSRNIDLRVVKEGGGDTAGYADPPPPDATPVTVGGHPGLLSGFNGHGVALIEWTADGNDIQLTGPVDGNPQSLLTLANSLIAVAANDPRVEAPANCRVPPGNTCPSASGEPSSSASPSATSS
jgi:hypothetical protein